MTSSTTARRDSATDEEFLAQLYKGGELLAAGKVSEAKDHLERAYQLHPKNEKAQNLLGLTYFKLGQFERASTIYEQLVNENPADPTLRVNLGLVYLKTNNLTRSVREFETATDLEPGHKKAHNYLGLALAQAGDYARAREHFVISGSDAMAEKMARAMISSEAPITVKMSPPPDGPPEPQRVPPPAITAPPPQAVPGPQEVQIEMMAEEEDVPAELDAVPQPRFSPPSAEKLLASQAQSMGGLDGPPLPQPGFEERPDARVPALSSDWGAQFGVDAAPAEQLRMAEDEGPSAATSEAAVATGMQVPASVMTETSSDEMPLVEGDVVEAMVEEVPADASPLVMIEQNVLVPVEDQGGLSEQPLPREGEPMVAAGPGQEQDWASGQGEAASQPAEQSWAAGQEQAPSPGAEQSWAEVAPGQGEAAGEEAEQSWAEVAPGQEQAASQQAEQSWAGVAPGQEQAPSPEAEQSWAEVSPGQERAASQEAKQSWAEVAPGQEQAPSREAEQSWADVAPGQEQAPGPESEQSWAPGQNGAIREAEQSWAEVAPGQEQEQAPSPESEQSWAAAPGQSGASPEAGSWGASAAEDEPLPDPVWAGPAPVETAAEPQQLQPPEELPSWVTGEAPAAEAQPEAQQWGDPGEVAGASPEAAPYAAPASGPEIQAGFQALSGPRLIDLGPQLDYAQNPTAGPFHIGPEGLALAVSGELLARLGGLVAVVGGVDAQPEKRRNRGRPIDQGFGEGPNQLQRVKGHGTLYLEPGKASFQAIDLDDEGCYLREERVFAFEEAVAFENGRLSAEGITVDMVHLKGHGSVLLRLEGTLKTMGVPPGTPLKVPLARLVGWYGRVAPRLRVFVGQGTVELTGEGYALLASGS